MSRGWKMTAVVIVVLFAVTVFGGWAGAEEEIHDTTEQMTEALKNNPNDVEPEYKYIEAGNSGKTVKVDPIHILSD